MIDWLKFTKEAFWLRQMNPRISHWQILFDLTIGIGLVIFTLCLDDIIFKIDASPYKVNQSENNDSFGNCGWLGSFRAFAYTFFLLNMIILALFQLLKKDWGFLSGVMATGALFSISICILFVPVAVVSILMIIFCGNSFKMLLGFVPAVVGFVYLRNAVRAYGFALQRNAKKIRLVVFYIGVSVAFLLPLCVQLLVESEYDDAITQIISQDDVACTQGIQKLKRIAILVPPSWMIKSYFSMDNYRIKKNLARAYQKIYKEDFRR